MSNFKETPRLWRLARLAGTTLAIILLTGCQPTTFPSETTDPTTTTAAAIPAAQSTTLNLDPATSTAITHPPTITTDFIAATPTITPHPQSSKATQPSTTTEFPIPTESVSPARSEPIFFGYTHQRADGNRFVAGEGAVPEVQPIDIPLTGEPEWLVAAPIDGGSLWVVVLTDSRVQGFRVVGDTIDVAADLPEYLLPGMPPHLKVEAGVPALLNAPVDAPSPLTHPIMLNGSGRMVFIHAGGEVIFRDEAEVTRLEVAALPDARLLVDEMERLLLLTDPTTRYGHGVLGDGIEAASITLIETQPTPRVALTIPIPGQTVVEGIAPIWVDLTGNGQREIIVTLSNSDQGAQIVVFNGDGVQIAAGPAIGRGQRWRHQLAVAPFGPEGELELVDVLTPHLGRVVEFFRLEGDSLRLVAEVAGYTSHVIGSRNLDMAVAGDFDGDDRVELLLPNSARTELGAIRRTIDGAEVAWTVAVEGTVNTNLTAVSHGDQGLALGVGREDSVLRLWLP